MNGSDKKANGARQPSPAKMRDELWPALPLADWEETFHTLHMWTQIIGKVRLGLAPLQNHWWNGALYVNLRGLTTSPIPYQGEAFEIQFDFVDHRLEILTSFGKDQVLALGPKTVAAFYREFLGAMHASGVEITLDPKPQEVVNPIPFDQDEAHRSYDPEYANRLWRILLSTSMVFEEFRARYMGKASPVHFFWGSFDLAYTRFSGRVGSPRKGIITSEAYSHECSSLGWWPGGGEIKGPAFYAYASPSPEGYSRQVLQPDAAYYDDKLGEFILMYDDVRTAPSPRESILEFAQSAYEAGANLGKWDRKLLERRSAP